MSAPITITVFPRLDCCVPDFTGKNLALSQVLNRAQETLGQRARIEVVGTATRAERVEYYRDMVRSLVAAGWIFPRGIDLANLPNGPLRVLTPSLRQLSLYLFATAPVVAVAGKAVFVGAVPSLDALVAAVEQAEQVGKEMLCE